MTARRRGPRRTPPCSSTTRVGSRPAASRSIRRAPPGRPGPGRRPGRGTRRSSAPRGLGRDSRPRSGASRGLTALRMTAASTSRTRTGARRRRGPGAIRQPRAIPRAAAASDASRRSVDLEVEEPPEKGLVGRGEQERIAEAGQVAERAEQRQRLLGRLAEVEPGVEDDPVARGCRPPRPGRPARPGTRRRRRPRRRSTGRGRRPAGASRMWVATTRGAGRRRSGQVVGVAEAADVVAEHRPGRVGLLGHRGPPRVDRHRDVEAVGQVADGRTTRSSSSASVTSGPGPAFTPPTSRMSAPSAHQAARPGRRRRRGRR